MQLSLKSFLGISVITVLFIASLGQNAFAQLGNGQPDPRFDVADSGTSKSTFGNFEVGLPGGGSFSAGSSIDNFISSNKDSAIKTVVGYVLTFIISILVIIGVITIVIGGYLYMTAAGNASQVASAKEMIYSALIGIFIAFISVVILNTINPFLGSKAVEPTLGSPSPSGAIINESGNGNGGSGAGSGSGSSGSGSGQSGDTTGNGNGTGTGSGTGTGGTSGYPLIAPATTATTPETASILIDEKSYYLRTANGDQPLSSVDEAVQAAKSSTGATTDGTQVKIYRTVNSRQSAENALTDGLVAAGVPSNNVYWSQTPLSN